MRKRKRKKLTWLLISADLCFGLKVVWDSTAGGHTSLHFKLSLLRISFIG